MHGQHILYTVDCSTNRPGCSSIVSHTRLKTVLSDPIKWSKKLGYEVRRMKVHVHNTIERAYTDRCSYEQNRFIVHTPNLKQFYQTRSNAMKKLGYTKLDTWKCTHDTVWTRLYRSPQFWTKLMIMTTKIKHCVIRCCLCYLIQIQWTFA